MARFIEVAPGLYRLPLMPLDGINVYLLGDVLVDAGTSGAARKLVTALEDRPPAAHALTHGHPDHQGSTHAVCEYFDVPLWCGEADRGAVEAGDPSRLVPDPSSFMAKVTGRMGGPAHPVDRALHDGDDVADFTVVETPGHTLGHLAFWREDDRVLVLGDVLFNLNPITLRKGPIEPLRFATMDPALNRESARKLAALEPDVVCFGHGPPLRDADRFQEAVRALPD